MAFRLSSFMSFFSSCLAGFTVEAFFPVSGFAAGGGLEVAQPVTVSKNMERANAVTMGMGPP
jgi:hypothetical protein